MKSDDELREAFWAWARTTYVDGMHRHASHDTAFSAWMACAALVLAHDRAELAALRAENEALQDDCLRLASYNAEESAHLRTRAEKAEAERDALRAAAADIEMHAPHDHWCDAVIDVKSDEHPIDERCDCFKVKLRAALKGDR